MGIFGVTGRMSGKQYSIEIKGDQPSPTEAARIQQYVLDQEAQFASRYQQQYGAPPPVEDGTELSRALSRGTTSAGSAIGTLTRVGGEQLGFDWLKSLGADIEASTAAEQLRQGIEQPAAPTFEDVKQDWTNLPAFVAAKAGESAPEMGVTMASTLGGGLIGGIPGAVAGFAAPTALFTGHNLQRLESEIGKGNVSGADFLRAAATGVGQTYLNQIGEKILLGGKALGLSLPTSGNLFIRAGQRGVAGAAVEAPTEIGQQIAERWQAGLPLDSDEAIQEYIEVGIAAGILGGAVGAGGAPFTGPKKPAPAPGATPPASTTLPGATPPGPATVAGIQKITGGGKTTTKIILSDGSVLTAAGNVSTSDIAAAVDEYNANKAAAPAEQAPAAEERTDLTPDELAELDAEVAGANNQQLLTAMMGSLGVRTNSSKYKEILKTNAEPTDKATLKMLADYAKSYEALPNLMEADDTVPGRIRDYIAAQESAQATPAASSVVPEPVKVPGKGKVKDTPPPATGTKATAPTAPTSEAPKAPAIPRYNALRAAGYTDEQVRAMTPEQRDTALAPQVEATPEATASTGAWAEIDAALAQVPLPPTDGAPADQEPIFGEEWMEAARKQTEPSKPSGPLTLDPFKNSSAPDPRAAILADIFDKLRPAAAPEAAPIEVKPKRPGEERAQKYPLSRTIGGIKRGSNLARQVEGALGVAPGKLPSAMYGVRGGGAAEVDTHLFKPDEHPDWLGVLAVDNTGNAFEAADFVNALVDEANGNPRLVGRQAEIAAERKAKESDASPRPVNLAPEPTPVPRQGLPKRNEDISTDMERYTDAVNYVRSHIEETQSTMPVAVQRGVVDVLMANGGTVEQALDTLNEMAKASSQTSQLFEPLGEYPLPPRRSDPTLDRNAAPGSVTTPASERFVPGFDEAPSTGPIMSETEFEAWLDSQINKTKTELDTEPGKPQSRAKRGRGANLSNVVRKVKKARPAHAAAVLDAAVEEQKTIIDTQFAAVWDARVASMPPGVQAELREFVLEPGSMEDPTTLGDRKAVLDLIADEGTGKDKGKLLPRKGRIDPRTKNVLFSDRENHVFAQHYFSKFPTILEGLQLIARDLGGDPNATRLINNEKKVREEEQASGSEEQRWLYEGVYLNDPISFLDLDTGYDVATNAMEWVKANLSPQAVKFVQDEVARMKRTERMARRRVSNAFLSPVTKEAALEAAERKAQTTLDAAVKASKMDNRLLAQAKKEGMKDLKEGVTSEGKVVTFGDMAAATEVEAVQNANARAELARSAFDPKARVSLPALPPGVVATAENLRGARTAAAHARKLPRRPKETGIEYALRVMRPELTPEQIKALPDSEVLAILEEAAASRALLGGTLFSKVSGAQAYQLSLPLDPIAINALRNGNLKAALDYVAAHIKDPQLAALARTLAKNIGDTAVSVVSYAQPNLHPDTAAKLVDSRGFYSTENDHIVLNEDSGLDVYTLLHEATHPVTLAELMNPDSQLRADLQQVFDAVYNEAVVFMPGERTLVEFVAELKTNPDLRARMAQLTTEGLGLPTQAQSRSVLEWIQDLLGKFIKRLQRRTKAPSVLDYADSLIDMVITPEKYAGTDILYAKRQGAAAPGLMQTIRKGIEVTSRDKWNTRDRWSTDAVERLKSLARKGESLLLSMYTTLQVADMAHKLGVKGAYAMQQTVQKMGAAKDRAIAEVGAIRDLVQDYLKRNAPMYTNLSRLAMDATSYEVDPTTSQDNYDHFWLAFETLDAAGNITGRQRVKFKTRADRDAMVAKLNTVPSKKRSLARASADFNQERLDAYLDVKRRFYDNTYLDDEGRALFATVRDFYAAKNKNLWDVLNGNIDQFKLDPDVASRIKKSAYIMVFGTGDINPYFPMVREGDYWLEFSAYNPITKSTEPAKMSFESEHARNEFEAWLKTEPRSAKDANGNPIVLRYSTHDTMQAGFSRAQDPVAAATVLQVVRDYNNKHARNPQKQIPDTVVEQLAEVIVEMAPEGSLAKQFRRRKGVAGYMEDLDAGLQDKGYALATAAPKYAYSKAIRERIKDYKEQSDTVAKSGGDPDKIRATQAVLNELAELGNTALAPQNTAIERAARAANKLTYVYTLLGSVASAAVQLSGIPGIIWSHLGGAYGYGKATSAITRASRTLMGTGFTRTLELPVAFGSRTTTHVKSMPTLDNFYVQRADGSYTVNTTAGFSPEQIARAEELLPLASLMSERGMSHHSLFYDSAGLEDAGSKRSLYDRTLALFGLPLHVVERFNRQVSAIATYDLELARMKASPTPEEQGMSDADLRARAAETALYKTQLMNGAAALNTAPRRTQRGLGRVMFMYKNYGITITTLLAKTVRQIWDNKFPGTDADSRAKRNEGIKQMTGHIGTTLIMAGVHGLPMFGLYAAVGNMLRDDDELTTEEATRLWMGELPYKGVLNYVTGFEIADRVGLSYLLYRGNRYNTDPSMEETLVQNVLGAPWATFSRVKRGVVDIASGEYQRGMESITPVAVSNLFQAGRFLAEGGVRTRQGNLMYEDPAASELLGKLLGFNMAEYVRRNERASEMSRISKSVRNQRTKLMGNLFLAERVGDAAGARAARQAIAEFNRTAGARYPNAVIEDTDVLASFKRRREELTQMVNGVSVDDQVREDLIRLYGAWQDGITRD